MRYPQIKARMQGPPTPVFHRGPDNWIAKAADKPVAGMLDMRGIVPDADPPHWLSYLEVDDVDRMVAAAQSHGGRIVRQPFDVPDFGRIAIGADATGAFMAWATRNADPSPLAPFALEFTRGPPRRVSSPTRAALARARAQALVGEDQGGGRAVGAFDNPLGPRDPPPLPAPTSGAGALTPSILPKCSRL